MKIPAQKLAWMGGVTVLVGFAAWGVWLSQANVSAELDGWRITAGPIEARQGSAGKHSREVSGSFRLQTKQQPPGTRLAGACLVANLTAQGVGLAACQTDAECNDAYATQPHPALAGAHLYCLGANTSGAQKQCWTRPGHDTDYCVKGPHSPGSFTVPAVGHAPSPDPLGKAQAVDWRVLACLNPAVFSGLPPCAIPDSSLKVYAAGPVRKISP
jgi:hypothetical protein